jgi:hypothetical protein
MIVKLETTNGLAGSAAWTSVAEQMAKRQRKDRRRRSTQKKILQE